MGRPLLSSGTVRAKSIVFFDRIVGSIEVFSQPDTEQIPNRCYVSTSIHLHTDL